MQITKIRLLCTILILLFICMITTQCNDLGYKQGEQLYKIHCANCHMEDGQGLRSLIPPLANADYLTKYKETIPCIIRKGLKGPIVVNGKTYSQEMVAIPHLNDVEINNIINYINHAWGNNIEDSNIKEVQSSLENCP